jgi:hypothetical protein
MAQPGSLNVEVNIDLRPARAAVKRLARDAREVGIVLARLDVQLAGLEERASELADYGITLEVEHV